MEALFPPCFRACDSHIFFFPPKWNYFFLTYVHVSLNVLYVHGWFQVDLFSSHKHAYVGVPLQGTLGVIHTKKKKKKKKPDVFLTKQPY